VQLRRGGVPWYGASEAGDAIGAESEAALGGEEVGEGEQ